MFRSRPIHIFKLLKHLVVCASNKIDLFIIAFTNTICLAYINKWTGESKGLSHISKVRSTLALKFIDLIAVLLVDYLRKQNVWFQAIADVIRTCLGPQAMLKMLMDPMGGIVMTNDGNAILREITVQHPAGKSMIEIARTQDEEVSNFEGFVSISGLSWLFSQTRKV